MRLRHLGPAANGLAVATAALAVASCSSGSAPRTGDPRQPPAAMGSDAEKPPATPEMGDAEVETLSLLGRPLTRSALAPERRREFEAKLASAESLLALHPDDVESHIWVGRRLAYLGRYRDAIDAYTRAISRWPEEARLYRHRGHRYITLRRFDAAIADLEHAVRLIEGTPDAIEPDGLPNAYGIPTSTSHSNIWYHLGLAYYLKGDFDSARRSWLACLEFSNNDDMLCATTDWLYMTLRRLGRDAEAARVLEPIHAGMRILENEAYHARLLLYRGERTPQDVLDPEGASDVDIATQGYGVGNWYLCNGDRAAAQALFERVVQGSAWAAFGFIAAEAELARWDTPARD